MWFGVLGPLLVEHDGAVIEVSAPRERLVLGALLVRANRVVSHDALIDAVWDTDPPASARVTLRNHVKRLRHTLGPDLSTRIVTRHSGYLLQIRDEEYDLPAFIRLCRRGRAAARRGDWRAALGDLDAALELWRGEPLADVCLPAVREAEVPRIEEVRLEALEARFDAQLALGASGDLVGDLRQLTGRYPLRERFHSQLMLALYRAGRQGEALSAYQAAHRVISAELGVQPGPELQELHLRILRAEPDLAASVTVAPGAPDVTAAANTATDTHADPGRDPAAASGEAGTSTASAPDRPVPPDQSRLTPRQLPAAPGHFVGREGELKSLAEVVARAVGGQDAADRTVSIAVIHGTAGIGKTSLALHCAHQVADRFPDGQLYVNLRGFDPVGQPMPPVEAVRCFLDALGVPVSRIPTSPHGQAALYRSLLADKRMLIVLDNARDIDQARLLLPGGAGCLVLITSRHGLAGLVVAEGAQSVPLDVLTAAEAHDLLGARLPAEQIAADPPAVAELIGLCAGLPLALGIVAARASIRSRLPLTALVPELRDAHSRLDALDIGDQTMDVRAAISWSYRSLGPAAARLFRLLGAHVGPDISAPAAASLAGVQPAAVSRALAELTRASLLTQYRPGRYSLHDLLRAYAAEQIADETELREAVQRVLDHYLHTGEAAALLLNPVREKTVTPPAQSGVTPERIADAAEALRWFEAEHRVLLGAIEQAAALGFDVHGWQLPRVMPRFFDRRAHWHDWVATYTIGLACAERLGDGEAQVHMHRGLGTAYVTLNALDEAYGHYQQSLDISRRIGDPVGQANAHRSLSLAAECLGDDDRALEHSRQALELYRSVDHRSGYAHALNDFGWSYARIGDFEASIECCGRALDMMRELGDEAGEAATYGSLGNAHAKLGHNTESVEYYQQALDIYRGSGDRYKQARTLNVIADLARGAGDIPTARESYRQALAILEEIGHATAQQVRASLRSLT